MTCINFLIFSAMREMGHIPSLGSTVRGNKAVAFLQDSPFFALIKQCWSLRVEVESECL